MIKKLSVFLLALILCGLVYAAGFNSLVDEARNAYSRGNIIKALEKLKAATLDIWEDVPLTVINPRLVADFKNYSSKPTNIYDSGEKILISSQLFGYRIKKEGEVYAIDISVDLYISDAKGNVLFGKEGFLKLPLKSPIANTEFVLDLTYSLSGVPHGSYSLKTVVNDLNSGKKTEFVKEIKIRQK